MSSGEAFVFLYELVGTKYVGWDGEPWDSKDKIAPFYSKPKTSILMSAPMIKYIQSNGCNCAGLINLFCHKFGMTVPQSVRGFSGGVFEWQIQKKWKPIKERPDVVGLEAWSLLLIPYETADNQGHLGIYMGKNLVAHSASDTGVIIETYKDSVNHTGKWLYFLEPEDFMIC